MWSEKFARGNNPGQSNVDLAMLNPQGKLVHWFDGYPRMGPGPGRPQPFRGKGNPPARPQERFAEVTLRELNIGLQKLNSENTEAPLRPVTLPALLQGQSGIRVFVTLLDDRMIAYRAPIVEAVPLSPEQIEILNFPDSPKTIDAGDLKSWLSMIYPPGVMERTDPETKRVYQIKETRGELKLAPISPDASGNRRAILSGTLHLFDEGPDDFTYQGHLEILLTYHTGGNPVYHSLKGSFDGIYPRFDPHHGERRIPLHAAFESLP